MLGKIEMRAGLRRRARGSTQGGWLCSLSSAGLIQDLGELISRPSPEEARAKTG